MTGAHRPRRPLWLCRDCAQPWPCADARRILLHEHAADRSALRINLATSMHEAVRDLLTLNPHEAPTPAELWTRFLAWTAPARRSDPTDGGRHPRT
ncbi:hypothetical protein O7627_23415 [Solwaraspora sp. WMMD1047]|uniref:hypothetical protein n=1 Tax=Solwaraspora sp. WMMD1047 TaxID=3016102 RepID=UPI0024173C98|nr:hypothetical protein [Solwaraspora sp. WMMD1047]MDG4832236.1 hypothetical protein [Solwaraspora sp. WMMD1047]